MRSLLDVNVLIALLDSKHGLHDRAHLWWRNEEKISWASCPLVENGVIRIMSNPGYHSQQRFTVTMIREQLFEFTQNTDHLFFPDDVSILNGSLFDHDFILGHNQLTDAYLLALAVSNDAKLVSLDCRISLTAVRMAKAENLLVI